MISEMIFGFGHNTYDADHAFLVFFRGRVGQRQLSYWPTCCVKLPGSSLSRIATANWTGFVELGDAEAKNAIAMDLICEVVQPYAEARQADVNRAERSAELYQR